MDKVTEAASECQGDGSTCVECGKLFSHAFYFGTHIVTHLGEKSFQPVGQCGMCGLVFSDVAIYQAHMVSLQSRLDAMAAEEQSVGESQQLEEESEPMESVQEDEDEPIARQPNPLPSEEAHSQPPQQQPTQQQQPPQQQQQRLSPFSEKKGQTPPPQPLPEHELSKPDSPPVVSKLEVKHPQDGKPLSVPDGKPLSVPTPPVEVKSTSDVQPSQLDDSGTAPVKREAPDTSEEGLPRKRLRRAPEKYEVYHEEKKRRAPKRKALPMMQTPPGYDPEVEKYLQSLRDMGYSVAPDNIDMNQGRQSSRGRGSHANYNVNPVSQNLRGRGTAAKRGRGTPRGRGMPVASFNPSAAPRQVLPPPRPFTNMGMGQRGRGAGGVGKVGGTYPLPSRAMMPMNAPRPKAGPDVLMRNMNQNFRPKMMEPRRDLHQNFTMDRNNSKRGLHSAAFGSHGMSQRTNQQFYKATPGASVNHPVGHNASVAPVMVPAPPPKAKVAYYDEEEEIVSLINGDLEIMPISGKSTRGERLRQRQERLSHDGPVEGGKKSVKYFPRTEKTKVKKSPKKQTLASAPNKVLPMTGHVVNTQESDYSSASNIQESTLQITNVHSLQPITRPQRARRGSRSRGRQSRSASKPHFSSVQASRTMLEPSSLQGHVNMGYSHQPSHQNLFSGRQEFVTEMGTVCNIEGRMEDLREEARKNVEDMLASPAAYLEHAIGRSSTVFNAPSPRMTRGVLANPRVSRGRTRGRGRSSRGRGRGTSNHRTSRGGKLRGAHISRGLLNRQPYYPADIVVDLVEEDEKTVIASLHEESRETSQEHNSTSVNLDGLQRSESPEGIGDGENIGGDDEDKDEIVEGADIDGWTVSISKMSDSEGEENETKDGKAEEEEEIASAEEVCTNDQSDSKDEDTTPSNDDAGTESEKSDSVTINSAVEKTNAPDEEKENHDHSDSGDKQSLDATEGDEFCTDETNGPNHENAKHQPSSQDPEDEDKQTDSYPENTNQGSVFEASEGEGTKACDNIKAKDDCADIINNDSPETCPPVTDMVVNVHQPYNDPVPGKIKISSESTENLEEFTDIQAGTSSIASTSSDTGVNAQDVSCDGVTPSETYQDDKELNQGSDISFSQQLDCVSREETDSDRISNTNENHVVHEGAEPESCDISETKNIFGSARFSPLTKADFNADGGSEMEADSGLPLDDSSDIKTSSIEAVSGDTPPSAYLKDSKADSSSNCTTALPSAPVSDLDGAPDLSSAHGDKVAEENQNRSQRLESDNGYDDTDNFSEIEKTCQEIIRDVENQEEERRANLEN